MKTIQIKLIFIFLFYTSSAAASFIMYPLKDYKGLTPNMEIELGSLHIVFRNAAGDDIYRTLLSQPNSQLQVAIVLENQMGLDLYSPPGTLHPLLDGTEAGMDAFMAETTRNIMEARATGQDPMMMNRPDYLLTYLNPPGERHWSLYTHNLNSYLTFYSAKGNNLLQIQGPRPEGSNWKQGIIISYYENTDVNIFGYPSDRGFQVFFVHKGVSYSAVTSIRDPITDGLRHADKRIQFKFNQSGALEKVFTRSQDGVASVELSVSAPLDQNSVLDLNYVLEEASIQNASEASAKFAEKVSASVTGQGTIEGVEAPTDTDVAEIIKDWIELEQIQETINTGGSPEPISDILTGIIHDLSIKQTEKRRLDIEDSVDEMIEPFAVNLMKDEINGIDLVGAPGVGKTWTVNALAHEFFWNSNVPLNLRKTQFFAVSASAFTATDGIIGRIKRRAHALVELARLYPHIVFVIDEIHSLKGAGVSMGNDFDIWNFLKPHMADGSLRIVGMGTEKELDTAYQDDQALRERRERITVEQPAIEKMPKILNGWLVGHGYNGSLSKEIASELAKIARRMGSMGADPRRSTSLLDYIIAIRKFRDVPQDKLTAFNKAELYEYAGNFYKADPSLFSKEALALRIEHFNTVFDKNVIGLKHIKKIMERKLINHFLPRTTGIKTPGQKLLLAGPPGSGKTHTSKVLALTVSGKNSIEDLIEGRDYGLLKGANYSNPDDAERFLKDIAQIVSINKFAVITVDEIDRAHPKVQDTLLSVLTEGIVEPATNNSFGNKTTNLVDVSLAQFVFTTNQGEAYVEKTGVQNFSKDGFLKSAPGLVPALVDRLTVVPVPNAKKTEIAQILEMSINETLASYKTEFGITIEASSISTLVQKIISSVSSSEPSKAIGIRSESQVTAAEQAAEEAMTMSARQDDIIEEILIDPINRYILMTAGDLNGKSLVFDTETGAITEASSKPKKLQCKGFL